MVAVRLTNGSADGTMGCVAGYVSVGRAGLDMQFPINSVSTKRSASKLHAQVDE